MDWQEWFDQAWEAREEKVYRELFGADSGGVYALDNEIFAPFGKGDPDPRWFNHGVFKFPPNGTRNTWLYVTSGLSNAWHDDEPNQDDWSGLGCELVLETAEDYSWALFHLRRLLAFQILLGWGRYEGRDPLSISDRIPLRNPIDDKRSELTWYLLAPPSGYPAQFHIPSGHAEFFHLVGITEAEAAFARENGHEALLEKLAPAGYPVTDPARRSVV